MENGNTIKGAGKLRVFSFVERFRKPLPLDVVSKELRRGVEDVRHSESY